MQMIAVVGAGKCDANPYVDIPIVTGMSEARNAIVVRSASAVIAIGGEYGTLSEIAFAAKFGIPIIGLSTWEVDSVIKASSALEAVSLALDGDNSRKPNTR